MLVEGASEAVLQALVPRLVRAVGAPIRAHGRALTVGVSVGAALSRGGADDPQGLLSRADARMYDDKRRAG